MTKINLPSWWSGASYTVKAGWLKSAGHAHSYEEACAMLARRPRRKPFKITVEEYQKRMAKIGID